MNASWQPSASWANLKQRAELLRQLRLFFDEHGFTEVETPLLADECIIDQHIDPIHTAGSSPKLWLQTSPELYMKRLLAAAGEAMYQVTRSFRDGESGSRHLREFTIVEWYRPGDSYETGMEFTSELVGHLLSCSQAERITYERAFEQYAGINPLSASADELATLAKQRGIEVSDGFATDGGDKDAWLNLLLSSVIEPELANREAVILHDYPVTQAALAEVCAHNPLVAQRFELYVRGVELANGYYELCDAEELRGRQQLANRQRIADGKPPLPEPHALYAAMEAGLPASVGVALGFDRLVMLATGTDDIGNVVAFS